MASHIALQPIARCRTFDEYMTFASSSAAVQLSAKDQALLAKHALDESWTVSGLSLLAAQEVDFYTDQTSGGYFDGKSWQPNLRERLVCPITGMNNRQRLVCQLINNRVFHDASVWLMEYVTQVYAWAASALENCTVIGSEYLGPQVQSGTMVDGIRHEDVENLSFGDASLDLIVSNDVFEHVPHPEIAFSECARVLSPGGRMTSTIPFYAGVADTIIRAKITSEGKLEHILEPAYHGNPIAPGEQSLVFTDFGWDMIDTIKRAGFRDCWMDVYHSPEHGHYGGGLLVFEAVR